MNFFNALFFVILSFASFVQILFLVKILNILANNCEQEEVVDGIYEDDNEHKEYKEPRPNKVYVDPNISFEPDEEILGLVDEIISKKMAKDKKKPEPDKEKQREVKPVEGQND